MGIYSEVPTNPLPRQNVQRASLTPEQEAKRYQLTRQVQELDELIQAKTEEKRRMDKEIDGLLAQKRRYVRIVGDVVGEGLAFLSPHIG